MFQGKKKLNIAYTMPHMKGCVCLTFFYQIHVNTAIHDFQNHVQYERALKRMTYTHMIAYTEFVSRPCLFNWEIFGNWGSMYQRYACPRGGRGRLGHGATSRKYTCLSRYFFYLFFSVPFLHFVYSFYFS